MNCAPRLSLKFSRGDPHMLKFRTAHSTAPCGHGSVSVLNRSLSTQLAAMCLLALSADAQSYRFARAWDGEKLIPNAVITIDHDRIKSLSTTAPADAIDMTRYTALPGLIDVHTHMTYVLDMSRVAQAGRGAATVYMSQDNAKKTLETGV